MDHNSLMRYGDRWIERAPSHCPNGHRLGPNRVLVGSQVCSCEIHHHRTHACRECNAVVYTPPLNEHCDDASFDGRAHT